MSKLYAQFTNLRDEKNSLIVLGLDPKEGQMPKVLELSGLKQGLIGFKPNVQFYQGIDGRRFLQEISKNIGPKMIRLLDCKSPDGAATNEAAMKAYHKEFEYMTIAPAAGCIEETIAKSKGHGVETISMGAMSFPGVLREIILGYDLFADRIDRAIEAGTSGFVLGATSYVPSIHFGETIDKYRNLKGDMPITKDEMPDDKLEYALEKRNDLFRYIVKKMQEHPHLVALVPGFGRQGGNLEFFLESGIDLNRCMINAGSDILKAENSQEALREMNAWINGYR